MRLSALTLTLFLLGTPVAPGIAQLIPIRTVPISQAHQFDLFPSVRGGMGGVSLAVEDSLQDPFGNPALAARLRAGRFFGSPGVYSVSRGAGAGRMLPVGAWVRSGRWFGGAAVAAQQVDLSDRSANPIDCFSVCTAPGVPPLPAVDRTLGNAFAWVMLGRELAGSGWSLAGSASWARLHGVDGTDLLYPGSARLTQRGTTLDLRLGALREWAGARALSGVLVHHRLEARHDVYYLDPIWDPGLPGFAQRPRLEPNQDHTRIWGLELGYRLPIGPNGWRLGWSVTGNLMSHPKLPNYEIQNIPRDPGNSEAVNLGMGVARMVRGSSFALDLVYEPIWSHTWADAAAPVETVRGRTIPEGGRTIENRFRFSNVRLRMGFSQDLAFRPGEALDRLGLQLGLAVHSLNYALRQDDNVQVTTRHQEEDWVEWSPTWGVSLGFPAWELRYRGRVTNGTGRPGVFPPPGVVLEAVDGRSILVAPSGPVAFTGVKVVSHQVAVVFPFR